MKGIEVFYLGKKKFKIISCLCTFKGTVSRDFLLLVFFMNQFPPSPRVFHLDRGDICESRCTTGINDTGGKFATGVNDTGGKIAAGINNSGGKFATGISDTGGKFFYQFR